MIIEHNCGTNKAIYTSLWITFGHNFDTIELWQK